ncbi:hypothetical protein AAFP30_14865 [Gordonia sp. CPCC 205515]|uniref:hypothetical protein n=1 Tax=Gordonia sp. CPCC 205515 TaxID=3140791 RepID=UPI003AF3FBFA
MRNPSGFGLLAVTSSAVTATAAFDHGVRVDQGAVHVEENRSGVNRDRGVTVSGRR